MQVTITIGAEEQNFVGGTIGGLWRIEAIDNASPAVVAFEYEGTEPLTIFDMPEGNTFQIRGMRLSDTGQILGTAVEIGYTVGEDLSKIWIAGSLAVKASP